MEDVYRTISAPSTGIYKEKGSKFLAFAFQVYSEDEIKDILKAIKKEHNTARHHCYAWRIGHEKNLFRANDDGEPSSTAGKPILGQILSFDLTNILIVVVRYFGGTLLGVSGLINAYKRAAEDSILSADIIEKIVEKKFRITFGYENMNSVMKILKDEKLPQIAPNFDSSCSIQTFIRLSESKRICELFSEIIGIRISEIS